MSEKTLDLWALDVTGQKRVRISRVPREWTIAELLSDAVARMGLVSADTEGRPMSYRARLEREGRHLHASELVGDTLASGDEMTISPHIMAG